MPTHDDLLNELNHHREQIVNGGGAARSEAQVVELIFLNQTLYMLRHVMHSRSLLVKPQVPVAIITVFLALIGALTYSTHAAADLMSGSSTRNIAGDIQQDGTWQCWGPGLPDPCRNHLYAVAMVSASSGWSAGENGMIMRWNGSLWSPVPSPTNRKLYAIDMVAENDGWAVGESGTILHWNGIQWMTSASPVTNTLLSVAMVSSSNGWAVGENGTILRWNGAQWSQAASPTTYRLASIDMVSANDGWAVGNSLTALHWNGSTWSKVTVPNSGGEKELTAVSMVSASEGWMTGYLWWASNSGRTIYGFVMKWDGVSWTEVAYPADMYSVDMVTPSDGWAVGWSGNIIRWNGSAWNSTTSPTTDWLYSVSMVSSTYGWAVGINGTLLNWNGATWTALSDRPSHTLRSISLLTANSGWAVGGDAEGYYSSNSHSAILRLNNGTWSTTPSESIRMLNSVDGVSSTEAWVGGGYAGNVTSNSEIARWDGNSWITVTVPTNFPLKSVAMVSSTDGWAVGQGVSPNYANKILHWNGAAWSLVSSPTSARLNSISALASNEIWAAGSLGTILHWNGTAWYTVTSPLADTALNSIAMYSPVAGWAVGDNGKILRWNGATWTLANSPVTSRLNAIVLSSATEGWAVGDGGVILRLQSGTWSQVSQPTDRYLYSIAISPGTNGTDAWAVGSNGIILRYVGTVPTYSISGHIEDDGGQLIPGVAVSAGAAGSAVTDVNGNYTFTGLTSGEYLLTPTRSGYIFSPVTRTITLPPSASNQDFVAIPDVSLPHIEVIQVTQDVTNNVPLISGKPTFVRVYVDCTGCTFPVLTGPNVTGILRGYGPNGELPGSPRKPVNLSITTYRQDWANQRGDLKKTLNFSIPLDWISHTITLTAGIADKMLSVIATFQSSKNITVAYVPIRDQGKLPNSERITNAAWLASRLYPTSKLNYIPRGTFTWQRPIICNLILPSSKNDCLISDLHNRLTDVRQQIPSDWYLFGWLPEGTDLGVGGDSRVDYKEVFEVAHLTESPNGFVHEIGHLLGRKHSNTVANVSDRNCRLNPGQTVTATAGVDIKSDWLTHFATPKIQDYGLNAYGFGWLISSPGAIKNPATNYDFMSYCGRLVSDTVWTSPWTYTHLFSESLKYTTEKYLQSPTISNTFFVASGLVFTDNTAILDPIWIISSTTGPDNPPIGSEYCLEAENSSGTPLVSRCFDLSFQSHESGESIGVDSFYLTLPYSEGVTRFVLRKNSHELLTRSVSSNSPNVLVISPNGGEAWSSFGTYTVTWTASDADGDQLTYQAFYSPDGMKWIPVGIALTQTQAILNASELPGGNGGKIRVVASDGVNNGEDESDAVFTITPKPPQVFILSPERDGAIPVGAPLLLQGYAYDLEDGVLADGALNWISSQDGSLGMGSNILTSLSQGKHTITFSATDSNGNTSTTAIRVNVGYWVYLPTVLKNR